LGERRRKKVASAKGLKEKIHGRGANLLSGRTDTTGGIIKLEKVGCRHEAAKGSFYMVWGEEILKPTHRHESRKEHNLEEKWLFGEELCGGKSFRKRQKLYPRGGGRKRTGKVGNN